MGLCLDYTFSMDGQRISVYRFQKISVSAKVDLCCFSAVNKRCETYFMPVPIVCSLIWCFRLETLSTKCRSDCCSCCCCSWISLRFLVDWEVRTLEILCSLEAMERKRELQQFLSEKYICRADTRTAQLFGAKRLAQWLSKRSFTNGNASVSYYYWNPKFIENKIKTYRINTYNCR